MQEETSSRMTNAEAMSMDEAGMGNADEPMEPGMPIDEAGASTVTCTWLVLPGERLHHLRVRASRTRMNRVLRDPERCTPFLKRLDALLEEFGA